MARGFEMEEVVVSQEVSVELESVEAEARPRPSVGRIVGYTVGEYDVEGINRRRAEAERHRAEHRERSDGVQLHWGNPVAAGDVFPAVIVRLWSPETGCANLRVLLDGNDTYWATSRVFDDPEVTAQRYSQHPGHAGYQGGTWHWLDRV